MGIQYVQDELSFQFNFEHDSISDVIKLTGNGYEVEAFNKCFYYGYEFSDDITGNIRSAFIKYLKFCPTLTQHPDLTRFIQKAINDLSSKIDLYDYDLVVMPESSSQVNEYMIRYIYRFAQPMLREVELIKALPERIGFDMDGYERLYLNTLLENGRPRYTEAQKQEVRDSINSMLDRIHQKDYFTIAKDVKKSRMRAFITDFLTFKSSEDEVLCKKIRNSNILVIDDIATSGSTLNEILRSLRVINDTNKITLFSLIGRKDLMAEQ